MTSSNPFSIRAVICGSRPRTGLVVTAGEGNVPFGAEGALKKLQPDIDVMRAIAAKMETLFINKIHTVPQKRSLRKLFPWDNYILRQGSF